MKDISPICGASYHHAFKEDLQGHFKNTKSPVSLFEIIAIFCIAQWLKLPILLGCKKCLQDIPPWHEFHSFFFTVSEILVNLSTFDNSL